LSANKYSADEFESDDSQQIFNNEEVRKKEANNEDQANTAPNNLDRYVISLG
jgi:hypothetical protein